MSTKAQISLSAVILVAALAVTALAVRGGESGQAAQDMEGHDHAAMMAGARQQSPVVLDADAARRIGVSFATVEQRVLPSIVQTVGRVTFDETRMSAVNPKISGWVEELHVDFTGAPVRSGEPLMAVYSPALVSAQEELVLAARLVREAGAGRALDNATELLESARRRLAYWDISESEIQRVEDSGEASRRLTIYASSSGIVLEKNVVQGDRIAPGMTLYRIADLSRVWVDADVYERDLGQVRVGQGALVSFEAFPGESFPARVTYIHPTVDMGSRTGRIRLELANPDLDFKPGMYAQVSLEYILSPPTLVVPRSAVIETGQRTLVFVEGEEGALLPRQVAAGRTEGRFTEILRGVEIGERVVSSAAFLVDAESTLGTMAGDMEMGEAGMEEMDHSSMDHSNHD
jgi:Cu(I)/Ag(I) efflux system membrane fusion protein